MRFAVFFLDGHRIFGLVSCDRACAYLLGIQRRRIGNGDLLAVPHFGKRVIKAVLGGIGCITGRVSGDLNVIIEYQRVAGNNVLHVDVLRIALRRYLDGIIEFSVRFVERADLFNKYV